MSEKILKSFDKWISQYIMKECLCESMEEITELRSNGQNHKLNGKKSRKTLKEHH